jgi:hypothetical protein
MILVHSLQTAVMVYALFFFFDLIRKGARAPAVRDPETGDVVLQWSKFLIWTMGSIAVLGPLAMVVLSFVIPFSSPAQVLVPIIMGLFFGLFGGMLYLYLARRRTRLTRTGLTMEYVFRNPAHIPWEEVETIKFSINNQELFLYGRNRKRAQIHIWMVGVRESAQILRDHLPEAVQREHQEPLNRFYKVIKA